MANISFTGGDKLEAILKAMAEKAGEAQELRYDDNTAAPVLFQYGSPEVWRVGAVAWARVERK
jgi:hypothetical protein